MDNDTTIPSQLGPANTIPAPLVSATGRNARAVNADAGPGLGLKLALAAVVIALLVYLIG